MSGAPDQEGAEADGARKGRPPKLTPEVQRSICDNVAIGLRYEDAAYLAGIGERTFHRWRELGAKGRQPYAAFWHALKEAEERGERVLLGHIHRAAKDGAWQAAAWILERRHPQKWGRKTQVTVDTAAAPGADVMAALKQLREAGGPEKVLTPE